MADPSARRVVLQQRRLRRRWPGAGPGRPEAPSSPTAEQAQLAGLLRTLLRARWPARAGDRPRLAARAGLAVDEVLIRADHDLRSIANVYAAPGEMVARRSNRFARTPTVKSAKPCN
jgi:hypothetical protein